MEKFLYGVSSSAFQVEGDDGTQGRGKSVWDEYCERENTIFCGQNAKVSCDHYHRYKEDVALMSELGVNAYRFSTSWSRILPNGTGKVNPKGLDFYDRLIDELLGKGIEPCLTMYHWDLPEKLSEQGGLKNDDFPKWFGEYAEILTEKFRDRVKLFIPFNEPINCVHSSYYSGVFAPGERLNVRQTLFAIHRLLLAQGVASDIVHERRKDGITSIAMSTFEEYPSEDTKECVEAAKNLFFHKPDRTDSIDLYLDPVFLGKYPSWTEKYPDFSERAEKDMPKIFGKLDRIGYNNYGGYPIDKDGNKVKRPSGYPVSALGTEIDHNSLYYNVKFLEERYRKPVIITENGYGSEDVLEGEKVHDSERADYIGKSLREVKRLLEEGIDLRGYFVWSFSDNFEWLKGYSARFGLVYVDYATQKRYKKDSFYTYKEIIERNGRK